MSVRINASMPVFARLEKDISANYVIHFPRKNLLAWNVTLSLYVVGDSWNSALSGKSLQFQLLKHLFRFILDAGLVTRPLSGSTS